MNEKRPKVGIGVYVFNSKGEILMGKRRGAHGEGSYSPPGGHLEFGESFEECARREVFEEAGISIKNISFAGLTNDIFEKEDKHYITIALTAIWEGGDVELKEPNKCDGWQWFRWQDLPKNLFVCVENLRKQIVELRPI